ncbi:MAG: aminotransferase class IV, partial [Bdellovibrionales bacterium]
GAFKNEKDNHVHHTDCGFTTGIGVFDSLLCTERKIQFPQDHFDRLIHDCEIVIGKTPSSFTFDKFKSTIHALLEKNNINTKHARIRTTITGGTVCAPLATVTDLNIFMIAGETKLSAPKTATIIEGIPRVAGCVLENCKRLDYTRAFIARRKAKEISADEAIITNTNGNIACGATSNIFIKENGKLFTPPLSEGVLAGVTRKNLIKDQKIDEEAISINRLKQADKIYLSNSFFGLSKITLISH